MLSHDQHLLRFRFSGKIIIKSSMDLELLKQDSIDVIIAARLKRNIDECFSQGPRHQSRIQLSFWTYPVDLQF